jgi:hypothetical protein
MTFQNEWPISRVTAADSVARCPSYRPLTTTAITPEACTPSAIS